MVQALLTCKFATVVAAFQFLVLSGAFLHVPQVVGRVHLGMDILDKLNDAEVDFKDRPVSSVSISSCGLTDAQGTHESVAETAATLAKQTETPEQAAARLQADAATAKNALQ